jgi:hypothetical protein
MPLTPLYSITDHPLLSDKFAGLKSDEARDAQHQLAELLLNLTPPAYTGVQAEELGYAIVSQINFQLQKSLEPEVVKSQSNTHPGMTTAYRDRYVSPLAWSIVSRVTRVRTVGFTPPGIGV